MQRPTTRMDRIESTFGLEADAGRLIDTGDRLVGAPRLPAGSGRSGLRRVRRQFRVCAAGAGTVAAGVGAEPLGRALKQFGKPSRG